MPVIYELSKGREREMGGEKDGCSCSFSDQMDGKLLGETQRVLRENVKVCRWRETVCLQGERVWIRR